MEIVVVFPAPLCPSKTNIWSLYIVIERSLTACVSPPLNILFRFWMVITFLFFYISLYFPYTDSIYGSFSIWEIVPSQWLGLTDADPPLSAAWYTALWSPLSPQQQKQGCFLAPHSLGKTWSRYQAKTPQKRILRTMLTIAVTIV